MRSFFSSPLVKASNLLFSTIVGAGVLGIPYVIAHVGLLVGTVYILGMGLCMMFVHMLIGELVIASGKHVQLTGIARLYCGAFGAWLMAGVFFAMHMGALVAYIIGEGESLSALFGGAPSVWSGLFFLCGAAVVGFGTRIIARFDTILNYTTLAVMAVIIGIALRHIQSPIAAMFPDNTISLLVPYGVLLFAFHGTSAIPEMEIITGRDPKKLRYAIVIGSLAPLILYVIFALTTVLVTGRATTEIATIGLGHAIGPFMAIAGNIFAIVAMTTSFITIGDAVRRTCQWDFGMRAKRAFLCALGVPALVYIVGAREFVGVIALVGGVFGSIEIFLLLLAYRKIYEKSSYPRRRIWWR